ncbi:MAG TPA: hypothetical protein VGE20_14195 [Ramlibacter sp.]
MSDAADKLAQTRLAIIAHLQGRERRHEHRGAERYADPQQSAQEEERTDRARARDGGRRSPAGWLRHAQHVARSWWRHHPASMGLELVTPALASYAARKPVQYLGIAAAAGAVFMVIRPWRLISVTGLIVAIVKSSQLSSVVMSAMAGADFGKDDGEPPV